MHPCICRWTARRAARSILVNSKFESQDESLKFKTHGLSRPQNVPYEAQGSRAWLILPDVMFMLFPLEGWL